MKDIFKTIIEKVDLMRAMTAAAILLVFFMIVNALIYRVIPPENKEILIHVLGIIEGSVMTLVTYEFGSSKGSAKKDIALIEKLEEK